MGASTSGTATTVSGATGNTSSSTVTVTGEPADDYEAVVSVVTGGTIGVGPVRIALSLDNGRNTGPSVNLGAATSYANPNTGLTLNFGGGALVTGDSFKFKTAAPAWGMGDVTSALSVLASSPVAWGGGVHIVGIATGANATTCESDLDSMATNQFRYTFGLMSARDFDPTDATEAAWMAAVEADFASVDAKRVCVGAGYVNVQSPIKNPVCGAPAYRRSISWPAAQRIVQVAPHVHLGRVRDGALLGTTGPGTASLTADGYIYHDERANPGFDTARLMAARTIVNRPGVYIRNPNLLAPPGSDFTQLHFRRVMDVACALTHDSLEEFINDSVRLNADGTILEKDAQHIEAIARSALNAGLVAPGDATSVVVVIDRTNNIQATSTLKITIRVFALGYLLEIDVDIGFQSAEVVS